MKARHELILALIYGFVVCLSIVLYVEAWFALYVLVIWLAVIVAPFVEELAKNIPTLLRKEHIISWALVVALGFALGEWFFHNVIEYISSGVWHVSFAPLMHLVFVLPCALLYSATRNRWLGAVGLLASIIIHGVTNWAILNW